MAVIAPALLAETVEEYQAGLQRLQAFAQRVQIDIMDGEFTKNQSVGIDTLSWPPEWLVDIHLMAALPSKFVPQLIALQPHMIILHVEASEDLMPIIQQIKQAGIATGIALLKPTVPKTVQHLINAVDHVMIFSGDLGQYGGKASMMQLEKVRLIRTLRPQIEIGWDGGATIDNVYSLVQGGVDVVNVGSAINHASNPKEAFLAMQEEIQKQSIM